MNPDDFWKAVLAFLLGLAAKFIYDLWKERRERKTIVFKKTISSSFVVSNLEKEIREQTQVYYQGIEVRSIHFVRLDLENRGSKPTKNQSFTIRFGDDATILGEPTSLSSSEDMRHVELDRAVRQNNSRRFLVKLLQGKRRLSWNIGVINHDDNDFIVEHGVIGSGEELEKADLDVVSLITRESLSPDLTDRLSRLVSFLIVIVVLSLIRNTFDGNYFIFNNSPNILTVILNVGIIGLWLAVLREALITIRLFMQWLEERREYTSYIGGDNIRIGDINDGHGVAVGAGSAATIAQPIGIDYDTMRELLIQAESRNKLTEIPNTQDLANT